MGITDLLLLDCTWISAGASVMFVSTGKVLGVLGVSTMIPGGWSQNTVPIASTQVAIKGIVQYSTRVSQSVGQSVSQSVSQ